MRTQYIRSDKHWKKTVLTFCINVVKEIKKRCVFVYNFQFQGHNLRGIQFH